MNFMWRCHSQIPRHIKHVLCLMGFPTVSKMKIVSCLRSVTRHLLPSPLQFTWKRWSWHCHRNWNTNRQRSESEPGSTVDNSRGWQQPRESMLPSQNCQRMNQQDDTKRSTHNVGCQQRNHRQRIRRPSSDPMLSVETGQEQPAGVGQTESCTENNPDSSKTPTETANHKNQAQCTPIKRLTDRGRNGSNGTLAAPNRPTLHREQLVLWACSHPPSTLDCLKKTSDSK